MDEFLLIDCFKNVKKYSRDNFFYISNVLRLFIKGFYGVSISLIVFEVSLLNFLMFEKSFKS